MTASQKCPERAKFGVLHFFNVPRRLDAHVPDVTRLGVIELVISMIGLPPRYGLSPILAKIFIRHLIIYFADNSIMVSILINRLHGIHLRQ